SCLWITGTESQVNGSTHLFIEENVFGAAIDSHVVAKSELAEVTCTRIQFKHLPEVLLPLPGIGLNHSTFTEDKTDTLRCATIVGGGNVELDDPMSAVLNRACEEFATGEVALAVAVDKDTVFDGE